MIGKKLMVAAALGLWALMGGVAQAATCGISGSASASPTPYDPFNPTGLSNATLTLNLTRVNSSGGGDTRIVNFYLKASPTVGATLDGTQIVPTAVTGSVSSLGTGLNIFYNYAAVPPTVSPTTITPSGSNKFLQINFTGNNAGSDTAQVTFQVTLPANLNINASQTLAFDALFGCNIQGGQDNGLQQTGIISNAVTFPITVLSAARVYYAGTALDFGEIGAISTASLSGTPQRTSTSNYVSVQSSGAYSVTVTSANAYLLIKPGGTTANDKIGYQLKFLGLTRNNTDSTTLSRSCTRAGVPTPGQALYIQGTLLEGGQGKNPSPTYGDILTVTVTPLVSTDAGVSNCGSFTIP